MANNVPVITFADLVEHLNSFVQAGAMTADEIDLKRACISAYRNLAQLYNWVIYDTPYDIYLNQSYSTGTIEYTESTRTVDFTGATLPSWTANARIKIGNYWYPIYSQPTASSVVLLNGVTPGADVDAGTSYLLSQAIYSLPSDMQNMDSPQPLDYPELTINKPSGNLQIQRNDRSTSNPPEWAALVSDHRRAGRLALYVEWSPGSAEGLRFYYRRIPRPLKLSGNETDMLTGTVTTTAGDATVVGVGTNFTSSMVGEMFRYSSNSTVPTGEGGLNPYVEQQIVASVTNATNLELAAVASNNESGVCFRVGSWVDIRPTMEEALLRGCEYYLMRARASRDKPVEYYRKTYHQEAQMAADQEPIIQDRTSALRDGVVPRILLESISQGVQVFP